MAGVDWAFADGLVLIYGDRGDGGWTIGEAESMRDLAALRTAIAEEKTWAEYKASISDDLLDLWWERANSDEYAWEDEDIGPGIALPATMKDIPDDIVPPSPLGWSDGEWPHHPEDMIPDWLPMRLIERFGEYIPEGETRWAHYGASADVDVPHLVEALEQHGALCVRDDDIAKATHRSD